MDIDAAEPVVPDEVAFHFTVRYVSSRHGVNVSFREPEIDHIDDMVVRREA
jgi:hypothetical protein